MLDLGGSLSAFVNALLTLVGDVLTGVFDALKDVLDQIGAAWV